MSWKRIVFSSIITILIIYCFRHFIGGYSVQAIRIEMEVYADKNILLECFYTDQADEGFMAGKSVQYLFQPQDSGLIRINLPVEHLHRLRLDLGEYPGKVRLGNLHIPGHTSLGYETGVSFSNIDNVIINQEGIELNSVQEDPYLVFKEPLNIDAKHSLSIGKSDILIALIISFIAFALFYKLFSFLEKLRLSPPDLVLVAVFFALLPLPAAKINRAELSVAENRTLAKFPALIVENKINNNIGTAFETWFNDRFFMRKQLVGLYGSIRKELNVHKQNNYILMGKDDWAFCKDDGGVQNYQNLNLFSPEELSHIAYYLSSIDDWCKVNDKKFYYLIAPDKNKIYGEYYKFAKKIRPDSESRTQQLIHYLNEHTGVDVIYPYESLMAAKQNGYLLYFKNDIHWSHLGAYCAYVDLMELISKDFNINPVTFTKLSTYKYPQGDANILFPKGIKDDTVTIYHCPVFPIEYTLSGDMDTKKNLFYTNPKGCYSAVFFRDSFATLLADYYLGNTFEHLSMKWQYKITREELDFVVNQQADIVVLEQVEKFIPKLLNAEILKN